MGAESARPTHPSQGDNMAVVRDAEPHLVYLSCLPVYLRVWDQTCPSSPQQRPHEAARLPQPVQFRSKMAPNHQFPTPFKQPVDNG